MDIKILFSILSVLIGTLAFFPYLKDVILKKTKPHVFTWLVWSITQGIATAGLWVGGGNLGAIGLTIGTILVIIIFLISLRDGKKDITKSDNIILVLAIIAIGLWFVSETPLYSVLLATAIDILGYIPTFRKSYNRPWSETAKSWGLFVVANIFAILSLGAYNSLTLCYLLSITVANSVLLVFLFVRRRSIVN